MLKGAKMALQRVFRGYDDTYLSNYYSRNTENTLAALKWIKEHKNNVGMPDSIGRLPFIASVLNNEEESLDFHTACKRWDSILARIIAGFEARDLMVNVLCIKEGEGFSPKATTEEYNRLNKIWEEGMELYIKHYGALWG
jgi:hypothetical protein